MISHRNLWRNKSILSNYRLLSRLSWNVYLWTDRKGKAMLWLQTLHYHNRLMSRMRQILIATKTIPFINLTFPVTRLPPLFFLSTTSAIVSCLGRRKDSRVELTPEMSQFITIPGGSRAILSSFLLHALIRHENTLPTPFRTRMCSILYCGAIACHPTCVLLPLAGSCPFVVCLRTYRGSTTNSNLRFTLEIT